MLGSVYGAGRSFTALRLIGPKQEYSLVSMMRAKMLIGKRGVGKKNQAKMPIGKRDVGKKNQARTPHGKGDVGKKNQAIRRADFQTIQD